MVTVCHYFQQVKLRCVLSSSTSEPNGFSVHKISVKALKQLLPVFWVSLCLKMVLCCCLMFFCFLNHQMFDSNNQLKFVFSEVRAFSSSQQAARLHLKLDFWAAVKQRRRRGNYWHLSGSSNAPESRTRGGNEAGSIWRQQELNELHPGEYETISFWFWDLQ